jgi:hypothetical protein
VIPVPEIEPFTAHIIVPQYPVNGHKLDLEDAMRPFRYYLNKVYLLWKTVRL